MRAVGEFIETISERAGLTNLRAVGERLKASQASADGSDLLDFGQLVIAGMRSTTGAGAPDTGALFSHGQVTFNRAGHTLRSASPDDRWEGAGSRAYADQNTRQQLRTAAMSDADREVHRVLYREAFQINLRRGYLDDYSDLLARTSQAALPLQFVPRYGEAATLAIEAAALHAALSSSAVELYQLHSEVAANATDLQRAVGRYAGVADGAQLPATALGFDQPPLAASAPLARAGDGAAERVPVAGQDDFEARRPQPCATVRLDPDSSPGPTAGMSPQDTN